MKLHQNQLDLILHLIRFNIMSYEDCLKFLDTEHTGDLVAMSYIFRPLTKNKYVAKNKDAGFWFRKEKAYRGSCIGLPD